jgi:hypothetical protein
MRVKGFVGSYNGEKIRHNEKAERIRREGKEKKIIM